MFRRSTLYSIAGLAATLSFSAGSGSLAAEPALTAQAIEIADAPETHATPLSLRIGDTAQDLAPEILWLRNMLVPEFKDDTVYILYLWSPDSPNSMGSFPQLHGLDQSLRDKGVVTISIAIDIIPDSGFEPIDVIKSRAEFMAHTVAEDRGTFIMDNWYTPTGYSTVPVVFVINKDGVIAYMDDKLSQIESVVKAVLAGDWDLDMAATEFVRVRDLEARMEPVIEEATDSAIKGDWARVIVLAEELIAEDKVHYYKMAMTKFQLSLTKLNKPGDAYEWGYRIIEDHIKNDSAMLVTMAELILFTNGIPYRDYNLARKAAERADILTGGQLGQVKHALAASWMGLGETGKAIEHQMEAVRLAPTSNIRQSYQNTLDQYLSHLPSP